MLPLNFAAQILIPKFYRIQLSHLTGLVYLDHREEILYDLDCRIFLKIKYIESVNAAML